MSVDVPVRLNLTNKDLIDDRLWNHLTKRISEAEGLELSLAERIMDQALGFLKLCAMDSDGSYSPSHKVDIGWHTFVLYTKEYAEFCEREAGRFLHHSPYFEDSDSGDLTKTVAAMKTHGIMVDMELWDHVACCCLCP